MKILQGIDDASVLEEEARRVCEALSPSALVDVTKAAAGLLAQVFFLICPRILAPSHQHHTKTQDISPEDIPDVFEALCGKHSLDIKVLRAAFRTFVLVSRSNFSLPCFLTSSSFCHTKLVQAALKNNVTPDNLASEMMELGYLKSLF